MADMVKRIAVGDERFSRHMSRTELGNWEFVGHLAEVFGRITVKVMEAPPSIITVNSDMLLSEAVEVLSKAGILCAPVIDVDCATETPTWREKYCGVFDLSDVVMFVVGMTKVKTGGDGHDLTDFRHAMAHKALFHTTRVRDIAHRLSEADPFLAVDEDTASLLDVIHYLGKGHYHRLFVTSKDSDDISNIITQSHVVDLLAQHAKGASEMTEVVDKTLDELGLTGDRRLISVNLKDEAYHAFSIMKEARISAVPVLGDDGQVLGNISTRDIRVLVDSSSVYKQIHSPLHHFIAEVKGSIVDSAPTGEGKDAEDRGAAPSHLADVGDDRAAAITCASDATLRVVLRLLHATRIHRVYVVEEGSQKPVSVITLTDILECMAPESAVDAGVALTRSWSKGSHQSAGSPSLTPADLPASVPEGIAVESGGAGGEAGEAAEEK
mmetsp:Transcript_29650/g.69954  ORF Transcript_29650/g.69954 Transcript_29650/m.69954 type:complete len:439 (-) Transcript_29650:65-1381(-)